MSYSISILVDAKTKTVRANSGKAVVFTTKDIVSAELKRWDLILYKTKDGKEFGRGFYLMGTEITLATEEEITLRDMR